MKTIDTAKTLNIVHQFFKQFSKWCGPSAVTPTPAELEKYLSKNLQMFNNGQLVVKGGEHYLERLQKFQKKYSSFQISDPLVDPIITDNQGAIYYKLDLTTYEGEKKQVFVIGLFTIEEDKISKWVEVSHEQNGGHWDT